MAYDNFVPRLFYVRNMFFSGRGCVSVFDPFCPDLRVNSFLISILSLDFTPHNRGGGNAHEVAFDNAFTAGAAICLVFTAWSGAARAEPKANRQAQADSLGY
jgi:hypothetical protein